MCSLPEARRRHGAYYLTVLRRLSARYAAGQPESALADLGADWEQIALAYYQAASDSDELVNQYALESVFLIDLYLTPAARVEWLTSALSAAQRLEKCEDIANHLMHLGLAQTAMNKYDTALAHYETALALTDDAETESLIWANMGTLFTATRQPRKAIAYHERAALPNPQAQAANLANLGNARMDIGETEAAINCYAKALSLAQQTGDRRGEGNCLGYLGLAYDALGNYERAAHCFEQALAIARTLGDRLSEKDRLGNLGRLLWREEKWAEADAYFQQALQLARAVGDRHGEGVYLSNRALIYRERGDLGQSLSTLRSSLAIAQALKDKQAEVNRLNMLGLTQWAGGQYQDAGTTFRQALHIAEEIDYAPGKRDALGNLGKWHFETGEFQQAADCFDRALTFDATEQLQFDLARTYHEIGLVEQAIDYYVQAADTDDGQRKIVWEWLGRACREVGLAYLALQELDTALEYLERARDAFLLTGSPDLEPLSAELEFVRVELGE